MAYICDKGIPCKRCEHHRWDKDNQQFACFAASDEKKSTSSFEMTASVSGYVTMTFDADTEDEAREAFEQYLSDADFGPLHDIDWDSDNIRVTEVKNSGNERG